MELRSSQERRPPKRYHGDGIWSDCNWGDDSPPATPRRASHNTNLRQQVRPVHTIDSTHSLARENSAHSAASATSRTTSLNTSPADIELQPSKHKHPIFDMAKRLPAKSSAFDSDFALGSGPDAHHVKPAVFPSLDAVAPLAADSGDSHSLTMLVDDRASNNLTVRRTSYELLEKLWKCDSFPDSMEEREKKWYRDVKDSIEVNEGHPKIRFSSLYESLRQTIIDNIRIAMHSRTTLLGVDQPILTLLKVDADTLRDIEEENADFCPEGDEDHFMEWKTRHPGEPLDPDMPPPQAVIKAIRVLRQERLPGNLLGEWQYPLPIATESVPEVNLAESGLDNHQIEDTNENGDTESEYDDTFIIAIPIASKYLTRLEKWDALAFQPLPAEHPRLPPPAIPTTPSEPVQSEQHSTSVSSRRESSVESNAMLEGTEPFPPFDAEIGGQMLPPPRPSPLASVLKGQRRSFQASSVVAGVQRASKTETARAPATPARVNTPLSGSKLSEHGCLKSPYASDPELIPQYFPVQRSVPQEAPNSVAKPPQTVPKEVITIDNDENSLRPLSELFPGIEFLQASSTASHQASHQAFVTTLDEQIMTASAMQDVGPKSDMADQTKINLATFEKMTDETFGGLHPSSVAKRKRLDPMLSSQSAVFYPSSSPLDAIAPLHRTDSMFSVPNPTYADKKRRIDAPPKTVDPKDVSVHQHQHQQTGRQPASSETIPSLHQRSSVRNSSSPRKNLLSQAHRDATQHAMDDSIDWAGLMGSVYQEPMPTPMVQHQYYHANAPTAPHYNELSPEGFTQIPGAGSSAYMSQPQQDYQPNAQMDATTGELDQLFQFEFNPSDGGWYLRNKAPEQDYLHSEAESGYLGHQTPHSQQHAFDVQQSSPYMQQQHLHSHTMSTAQQQQSDFTHAVPPQHSQIPPASRGNTTLHKRRPQPDPQSRNRGAQKAQKRTSSHMRQQEYDRRRQSNLTQGMPLQHARIQSPSGGILKLHSRGLYSDAWSYNTYPQTQDLPVFRNSPAFSNITAPHFPRPSYATASAPGFEVGDPLRAYYEEYTAPNVQSNVAEGWMVDNNGQLMYEMPVEQPPAQKNRGRHDVGDGEIGVGPSRKKRARDEVGDGQVEMGPSRKKR